MKAVQKAVDAHKDEWVSISWDSGIAERENLIELRTRADAYAALIDTDYARWAELNAEVQ